MKSRRTLTLISTCLMVFLFSACVRGGDVGPDRNRSSSGKSGSKDAKSQEQGRSGAQAKKRTINDLGPLGSAARAILDPHSFSEVVVELAHVEGRAPSDESKNHVEQVLSSVAKKPVRINTHQIPAGDGSYSSQEILELSKNRAVSSSGTTASIWVGFLDGQFAESSNALGVAVAATVAAVFPDRIGAVGSLLSPSGIEKSVLLHEIGHILALINIGYQSQLDHEDPEHPHHSKNEGSVMHWAVEDISVRNVFRGGPPSDFDEADRADLEMLRSS